MHWRPHGLLILGGTGDPHDWICHQDESDADTECCAWTKLPPIELDGVEHAAVTPNSAAVVINARLLVAVSSLEGAVDFDPLFLLLEPYPWRWTRCICMGAVPRGVTRRACQLTRSVADVLILSGGHDGTSQNQFGDPGAGFHAPHEARART